MFIKTIKFTKARRVAAIAAAGVVLAAAVFSCAVRDEWFPAAAHEAAETGETGESPASPSAFLPPPQAEEKKFIKWVDFTPTYSVMKKTLDLDVKSHSPQWDARRARYDWIELLAYLAAKNGGNFKNHKDSSLTALTARLDAGESMEQITSGLKYYEYYKEAYAAVLGGFVGTYRVQADGKDGGDGEKVWEERYGLKVFSPIAKGYYYNDYDDFGVSRSYGYRRKHLGHDLMGGVGTPIVAVESGVVEELGWNQYGGWRVGIRSFDEKRYYYYAHLRQNRPFHASVVKGGTVAAGDVIGYMGRTGYSAHENVNNIENTHLHIGMQLIFDESQKEGNNEIWIDLYAITRLLSHNRSAVYRDENKEYHRAYAWESLDYEG